MFGRYRSSLAAAGVALSAFTSPLHNHSYAQQATDPRQSSVVTDENPDKRAGLRQQPRTIPAELVDQGDHYFKEDGTRSNF